MAPLKLKNLVIRDSVGRSKSQNLCFVNAEVQLLASIETFKSFFVEQDYLSCEVQIANAQYAISDILHDIFSSNGDIEVSCSKLRSLVAQKSGNQDLSDGKQHDTQEFHFALVDSLEKEFQEAECQSGRELMEMFYGTEVKQKCYVTPCAARCKPNDITQRFSQLSLIVVNCRSGIKLETLIKARVYLKESNFEIFNYK